MQLVSLLSIGITAIFAWRVGDRWCRRCGVDDRVSAATLSCIVSTSAIVAATHLVAIITLAFDVAIVSPVAIAIAFVLVTAFAHAAVERYLPCTGEPAASQRGESTPPLPSKRGRWMWPVAIITALYALFFVDAVLRYPTGVDGLHYHLPLALEWMRTGRMDLVVGLRLQSLPENGMIVVALLLSGHLESLVTVATLPYGLVIGAAIYGLARQIGGSTNASIISACVVLSIPIVLFQSFSSYIDVYAASAWLCSLLAIVWATRAATSRSRWGLLAMAGVAGGLALGSKTTYLVLVLFLLCVVVRAEWIQFSEAEPRRPRPVLAAAIFLIACLPCSIFWFVRGAVEADNPIYPLGITVAGREVLPGFDADSAPCFQKRTAGEKLNRWGAYLWRETKFSGTGYPYSVNNALGAPFAMLVPLSILGVATGFLKRKSRSWCDRWTVVYTLLALGGVASLVTFFRENLRFVLPCVLIATPLTSLLLDRMGKAFPRILPAVVTIAFATTAVVAGLPPAHALAGRIKDRVWTRADFYEIPDIIDTLPPGSRILNLASPYATYPLFGKRLDLDVVSPHHWSVWTAHKTTAEALYKYGIQYVYYRPVYNNSWRENLPLELLYDDTTQADPLSGPPRRLFRVLPHGEYVANSTTR